MKEKLKKAIEERDSKMFKYYKSVLLHGYEGGYPMEWDKEIDDILDSIPEDTRSGGL